LPAVLLLRNYAVTADRDLILHTLASEQFDPRSQIILEREPPYRPVKGNTIGVVEVVSHTTDSLEIRADVETPAILLITNNYARGWRARSVSQSSAPQSDYEIAPANWTQQSIALTSGRHHVVVEYLPVSFRIGRWISILSLITFAAAICLMLRRRRVATH
jgi:uncharacterized membrane protein YfhO